jgi:hypothetical protein
MKQMKKQAIAALSALLMFSTAVVPAAFAHNGYRGYSRYNRYDNDRYYRGYNRNYSRDQYIKKAAIGGGAGALIGGLMSEEGYRTGGAVKGGLLGAGAGLGYEYLRRRW